MSSPSGMILVTGAARRIGRIIALHLAECGWDILIHYNKAHEDALSLKREIESIGQKALLFKADFSNQTQLHNFAETLPSLSGLVHNASLFEHNEKDPDGSRHMAINYGAPLYINDAILARTHSGKDLSAVFMFDHTDLPAFLSHYRSSKEILRHAFPKLARLAAPRLRLNALALGPSLIGERETQTHFDHLVQETPLMRATSPQDIAQAVNLLLSAKSMTGNVLNMDSGLHFGKN